VTERQATGGRTGRPPAMVTALRASLFDAQVHFAAGLEVIRRWQSSLEDAHGIFRGEFRPPVLPTTRGAAVRRARRRVVMAAARPRRRRAS
jgi:hypothetical protein